MPDKPSDRRAALSDLTRKAQQAEDEKPQPKPKAVVISEVVDAVNFLLSRIGCPGEFRAFINAVVGASKGRSDWFEANDLEIGKRIIGRGREINPESIRRKVQRMRKDLLEWQEQSGKCVVLYAPGGKDFIGYHPSQYKVPLVTAAILLLQACPERGETADRKEMQRLSKSHASWLTKQGSSKVERFRRPMQDTETQVKKNTTTLKRLLRKTSRLVALLNGDPSPYDKAFEALEAVPSPSDLLDELDKYANGQ